MLDLLLTKCLIPRDKKNKNKNKKETNKKNISLGRQANWVQYHTMYKLKTSCQVTLLRIFSILVDSLTLQHQDLIANSPF